MSNQNSEFNILHSIKKHTDQLRLRFFKSAVICVGEYLTRLLLNSNILNKTEEVFPVFINRFRRNVLEWSRSPLDPHNSIALDIDVSTHFWFSVFHYMTDNDRLITSLKHRSIHNSQKSIFASSTWDGLGSGLSPFLLSQFRKWNMNAVAVMLLPSEFQSPDSHFNAVSSVGKSLIDDSAPVLLIDRDHLEDYVGVNRNGTSIRGNAVIDYVLELMLAKETLVQELVDLSRVFGVRAYTILLASGASLRTYGSLENILESALLRPLLTFDLSGSRVGYILLRVPVRLKDELSVENIELKISEWFRRKANFESLEISEPVYVEDFTDRIDAIAFVGGFNMKETFGLMLERGDEIRSRAVASNLLDENEWKEIVGNLTGGHD